MATQEDSAPLPLPLELSIPFLAAGELAPLASVSRACRRAALRSLHSRPAVAASATKLGSQKKGNEDLASTVHAAKKPRSTEIVTWCVPKAELPQSLHPRNPFCNMNQHNSVPQNNSTKSLSNPLIQEEEDSITVTTEPPCWRLQWNTAESLYLHTQHARLAIPQELVDKMPRLSVKHCSLEDEILLLIVVHKFAWNFEEDSDEEAEEEAEEHDDFGVYDEEGAFFGKQVYSVLYQVSDNHGTTRKMNENIILQPLSAQTLCDPVTSHWCCSNDCVEFAQTCRSGQVFACLAALPNAETPDVDYGTGERNATYLIFDIVICATNVDDNDKNSTLSARTQPRAHNHRMVIFTYVYDDYNHLEPSLSPNGKIFSVLNTGQYEYSGGLFVFDISPSSSSETPTRRRLCSSGPGPTNLLVGVFWGCEFLGARYPCHFGFFTRDSELVLHWGRQETTDKLIKKLESSPASFAGRVVLVVEPPCVSQ